MRCRVGCISLKLVSRASACVFRFVSGGIEWDYSALPKRDHFEFHETLNFIYELPHVLILKMSNRLLFGKARKRLLIPYISTSQVREILSPLLYNIGSNIFLFALFCVVFNLIWITNSTILNSRLLYKINFYIFILILIFFHLNYVICCQKI